MVHQLQTLQTKVANITADSVVQALFTHWISRFGTPTTITSDQGSQFELVLFKSLAQAVGAKKHQTTAFHHSRMVLMNAGTEL